MKRNYWPLLFIFLFCFAFGMIVWTIVSAVNTPVNEDRTFLQSYQDVDTNFNDILEKNNTFKKEFNVSIIINNKKFPLSTSDIFYSQRVLEKKSKHNDLLKKGQNSIAIEVSSKDNTPIKNARFSVKVTKATTNNADMDFFDKKLINGKYLQKFDIPIQGNWNITGTITVDDKKGYFYIKTNAL